jgi:maltooligosyltrehalose synthase
MKLIKELDFKPLDKFVVTFSDYRTYMAPQSIVDKEKSTVDETVTKVINKKVKYNHQIAVVVSTPTSEQVGDSKNTITVGDKVFVDYRACMPLDGYEELYMIPKYNILGVMCD